MNDIRALRTLAEVTQASLAETAGTSQSTIAAYESGSKSPTLNTVYRLASAVGLEARIEYSPPLTREDRRSLFLHAALARKLRDDPVSVLARARVNLATSMRLHPGARGLLREWKVLIERPLADLIEVLQDPRPRARELRHVTPFAGVLSAPERSRVYREFSREQKAS